MKSESKSKKVITKKLSDESDKVESVEKEQEEKNDVSVFTRSTNPRVVVGLDELNNERCDKRCSWRVMKFVFMVVMSILLIITFFLSLKTYWIVESLVGIK